MKSADGQYGVRTGLQEAHSHHATRLRRSAAGYLATCQGYGRFSPFSSPSQALPIGRWRITVPRPIAVAWIVSHDPHDPDQNEEPHKNRK